MKNVEVKTVFKWVVEETSTFLDRHARTELEKMLSRGEITFRDPDPRAIKRQKFKWPERIILDFI